MAEAFSHRRRRQLGQLPQSADPEPLEHAGQPVELRSRAEQRHRQGRQECACRPDRHHRLGPPLDGGGAERRAVGSPPAAPRTRARSCHVRDEATRSGSDPQARGEQRCRPPAPIWQNFAAVIGAAEGPPEGCQHVLEPPAVDPAEAIGLEECGARLIGLDARPDSLEPVERLCPDRSLPLRIGRDQPQSRTARERLPHGHPARDAECLRRGRRLPHPLLTARRGRQRDRLAQQRALVPERREQGQSGNQQTDDHVCERMFAYSDDAWERGHIPKRRVAPWR